ARCARARAAGSIAWHRDCQHAAARLVRRSTSDAFPHPSTRGEGGTMQRKTSLLVAVMLLTIAAAAAAQSGDPYQQNQPAQGSDAAVNQQSTTPAQTPTTPAEPQTSTPADPSTTTSSELPKTASPLPLMGLGGLVSLAAGAWMTRPRRRV